MNGIEILDLPAYIKIKNKSVLLVKAGAEWEGYQEHRISIEDVIRYYRNEAPNISSGCRSLGRITGDWRNIDYLAKECLEVFKNLNMAKLRSIARQYNLEPRF